MKNTIYYLLCSCMFVCVHVCVCLWSSFCLCHTWARRWVSMCVMLMVPAELPPRGPEAPHVVTLCLLQRCPMQVCVFVCVCVCVREREREWGSVCMHFYHDFLNCCWQLFPPLLPMRQCQRWKARKMERRVRTKRRRREEGREKSGGVIKMTETAFRREVLQKSFESCEIYKYHDQGYHKHKPECLIVSHVGYVFKQYFIFS